MQVQDRLQFIILLENTTIVLLVSKSAFYKYITESPLSRVAHVFKKHESLHEEGRITQHSI